MHPIASFFLQAVGKTEDSEGFIVMQINNQTLYGVIDEVVSRTLRGNEDLFCELRVLGNSHTLREAPPQDIDILMVLNGKEDPIQAILVLRSLIDFIRCDTPILVVTDSLMTPLVFDSTTKPLLHVITFLNDYMFQQSGLPSLLLSHDVTLPELPPSRETFSSWLAAQELLKFWLLRNLNPDLPDAMQQRIQLTEHRLIEKWLSPICNIDDNHTKQLVKALSRDCQG